MAEIVFSPELTPADGLVLQNLADDIRHGRTCPGEPLSGHGQPLKKPAVPEEEPTKRRDEAGRDAEARDALDIAAMTRLNDPAAQGFEPTVFSSVDLRDLRTRLHPAVYTYVLEPYIAWARKVARYETDVVMVTHLLLYVTTSVPSAVFLFYRFSYLHGVLHALMQGYYIGAFTLMRHQHIHQRGVLAKRSWMQVFDQVFPYVLDPLMGHTWNSYFYHHVKHHHVEGNGPDDLSSTIRYQRDDVWHFLHYVGRFYFFVWLDLPLYFIRKGRLVTALKAASWELGNYAALIVMLRLHGQAAFFTLLLPLLCMRLGLMVGNWGQHAFVDADEPDSDFRSSITLIDVPSNRYCYNDGYHTSHHLNPRRHWRDHPVHFLQQKRAYAREHALVFHDIDYLMITFRLLRHDYDRLARCLVPINQDQANMSQQQRADMLRRHTRRFPEEEIREKFGIAKFK
ncbi:fatty acid desaturase [Xylariomycetidae sp. FL0641]|nr:fatty acid desaturase [Xylariomycetidae sp. FL0641]